MSFLPELYIWYNFVFWDNPLHVPHRKYSSACNIYNLLFTRLGELQGYFVIDMQDKSFQHYNIIKLIQIMKIKLLPGPYLSRFICSKWRNTHTSLCFGKSALNQRWQQGSARFASRLKNELSTFKEVDNHEQGVWKNICIDND